MDWDMGQKKEAILETYLSDIIFSEEQIKLNVENSEHIFEIKDETNTLGFISLYDLKAYILEHEDEAKSYSVRKIDSHEWADVFEHPLFQRRKPQIINDEVPTVSDDQEFYILKKGQKVGPIHKAAIVEMITDKQLLLTDMISLNAGLTWMKIYQIDDFDRRALKESEQLPVLPSSDLLNMTHNPTKKIGDTTDAFTSLAYLGNLKRGKAIEVSEKIEYESEMTSKANTSLIYKTLMIVSIIGIIYFLYNIKNQINGPISTEENNIGEQNSAEIEGKVENSFNEPRLLNNNIYDQGRKSKFQIRKLTPVRPSTRGKSFMDTQSFKDSNEPTSVQNDDGTYYYDNSAPMELDPIRSQVSKENYDASNNEIIEPPSTPGKLLFNQD